MTTYEGWSNYPTWAVNLWIANERCSHEYWTAEATMLLADAKDDGMHETTAEAEAVDSLADELKRSHEDGAEMQGIPGGESNVFSDLVGWTLEQVNWREIAEHMIEAAKGEA